MGSGEAAARRVERERTGTGEKVKDERSSRVAFARRTSYKYAAMARNRLYTVLGFLFAAAFACRIGYGAATIGLGKSRSPDHREYIMVATRLLDQGTLGSPLVAADSAVKPSNLMPPLYAAAVAATYAMFGVDSFTATLILQIINALATSLAVCFVFLSARAVAGGRAGWAAAAIALFNPALFGYTGHMWDTSLFTLAAAFSVWFSLRLSDQPVRWQVWGAFGLLLGTIALLNPALTICYPLLVLWPLHRSGRFCRRHVRTAAGSAVLGWLVVIAPWTVRNYVHFGELSYIRGGFALEIWLGVCPEADDPRASVYSVNFPLKNPDVLERVSAIGERAYIAECRRKGLAAIADDPGRFVRLTAVRFVDYWLGSTLSHRRPGQGGWPESKPRAAVALFLTAEAALLLIGVGVGRGTKLDYRWLLAIVIGFSFVYCLTHVEVRYRAPSEPVVAILVGATIAGLARSRRQAAELHRSTAVT